MNGDLVRLTAVGSSGLQLLKGLMVGCDESQSADGEEDATHPASPL
jgi:hypothetical protein